MADETVPRIGETIRQIRERRGFTQRELAENSGVSIATIRLLEQHPDRDTSMDTLRRLATALSVSTSDLLRTRRPELVDDAGQNASTLIGLRGVLAPIPRLPGLPITPAEPPTLARITRSTRTAAEAHRADDYRRLIETLPELICGARQLVQSSASQEHAQASTALSAILRIAGMTLRQLNNYDLAVVAYGEAIEVASRVDDHASLAYAAARMADVYMCQRRFGDAADMCVRVADMLQRTNTAATLDVIRARTTILTTAGAAAVRDGRDVDAILDEAAATATGLPRGDESAVRVAAIRAECAMITDQPDAVLDHSRSVPRTTATWTHPNMVRRHRLDVAHAHVRLGDPKRATRTLINLGTDAPAWLARQPYGREIVAELMDGHRRLPTDLAQAADLVGMPV
jgi:transcriptional regulator with XRE-family HTH domain